MDADRPVYQDVAKRGMQLVRSDRSAFIRAWLRVLSQVTCHSDVTNVDRLNYSRSGILPVARSGEAEYWEG